jgi:hypothetical protein
MAARPIPVAFRVATGRFPPHPGGLLDAPQTPSQPSQGYDLLFLFFTQDVAHADGGYIPRQGQRPGSALVGRF